MPTHRSREILNLIRAHKKQALTFSDQWLMRWNPSAEALEKMPWKGAVCKSVSGLGMQALMIHPLKEKEKVAVILHLHGGAYISGGLMQSRALMTPICTAAGIPALTISYRLAPEHTYPAQLEDARNAWNYLREQGYRADQIALVGESAGGNLALELTLLLRSEGEQLPAALALLSPWTDLAQTGDSYRLLRDIDPTLDAEELLKAAIYFAGSRERLSSPEISPAFADFTGFPPMQIHCGTLELLLSDSENLAQAMLRDHVDVQLIRWEGMCHVFQAFGFEESKASNHQIGQFLRRHLLEDTERGD